MNRINDSLSKKYMELRSEINMVCQQLHNVHQLHTQCRKGCAQCCINFSVLPIEFFSILNELQESEVIKLNNINEEQCLFLVENSCQIYQNRPSICRSHGLPILNMDHEGENWELSFCPLNFKETDETYFTLENGFQQDLFNSKLYMLNKEFIQHKTNFAYNENELIDLRQLKEYL